LASKGGEPEVGGQFFGQSSFANLSIVRECSVVNAKELVHDKKELQLFAPLGCGIQTGESMQPRRSSRPLRLGNAG